MIQVASRDRTKYLPEKENEKRNEKSTLTFEIILHYGKKL
jgi:hypothetical protein